MAGDVVFEVLEAQAAALGHMVKQSDKVEKLQAEVQAWKDACELRDTRLDYLADLAQGTAVHRDRLQADLESSHAQGRRVGQELKEALLLVEEYKAKLENSEFQRGRIKADAQRLEVALGDFEARADGMKAQVDQLTAELPDARERIRTLEADLDAVMKERDALDARLGNLSIQHGILLNKYEDLQGQLERKPVAPQVEQLERELRRAEEMTGHHARAVKTVLGWAGLEDTGSIPANLDLILNRVKDLHNLNAAQAHRIDVLGRKHRKQHKMLDGIRQAVQPLFRNVPFDVLMTEGIRQLVQIARSAPAGGRQVLSDTPAPAEASGPIPGHFSEHSGLAEYGPAILQVDPARPGSDRTVFTVMDLGGEQISGSATVHLEIIKDEGPEVVQGLLDVLKNYAVCTACHRSQWRIGSINHSPVCPVTKAQAYLERNTDNGTQI